MKKDEKEIKDLIETFITKENSGYNNWHVGITDDPNRKLFKDQKVDKSQDYWIYRSVPSSKIAKKIEKHFINLGCNKEIDEEKMNSNVVFAFKRYQKRLFLRYVFLVLNFLGSYLKI